MDYERLCEYYDRLEATTKRLEMTDILVELLREAGEEIRPVVYLTRGQLAADFVGLELGVADKLAIRAIAFASGFDEEQVTKKYREEGDLGDAALALLTAKKPRRRQATLFDDAPAEETAAAKAVTVSEVFQRFVDIANASGTGSQERKLSGMQALLQGASPRAARYIVRTTTGKLRLGIADMTFLDAMAGLFATKEYRPDIERAYNVSSDIGLVAETLHQKGMAGLEEIKLQVGVPVRAMLAERLPTPEEILEKLGGEALAELKYDGLRLQAHVPRSGAVRFYSRRLEDLTPQFPDVAEALRAALLGKEAIVEGEVVAVDEATGEMRPFQDTALRRGRKRDLAKLIEEMPVTYFLFDALLLDGEDLTTKPLPDRRAALTAAFGVSERVQFTDAEVVRDVAALNRFFERSVAMGAEGIMVKSMKPDSTYQPGSRGYHWIKYKREYSAELTDSLDLACVGALVGRGRRAGLYGAFLMAAYNPEEDVFETVCKMGTGLNDEQLAQAKEMLEPLRHDGGPHPRVRAQMPMDVWFNPVKVAEVVGAELTLSPIHTAAWNALKEGAGLALRFPRFVKWRDDKDAEQATNLDELVSMFKQQAQRRKGGDDEG